jgi:hypothetical protein
LKRLTLDRRHVVAAVAVGVAVMGTLAAVASRTGPDATPSHPPSTSADTTVGTAATTAPTTAPATSPTLVLTAPSPSSTPCPTLPIGLGAADLDGDGCAESWWTSEGRLHAGGRTFAVGSPGDLVAVGDWDCDGSATPALVVTDTGGVFLFPAWATAGADVHVDAAGMVEEAAAVTVVGDDTCDSLHVAGRAGVTVFTDQPPS